MNRWAVLLDKGFIVGSELNIISFFLWYGLLGSVVEFRKSGVGEEGIGEWIDLRKGELLYPSELDNPFFFFWDDEPKIEPLIC